MLISLNPSGTSKHGSENSKRLPGELDALKSERAKAVRAIYQEINALARIYALLYSPVERAIAGERLGDQGLQIGFKVSIVPENFEDRLFQLIQQGRRGTFCGVEEGQKKLRKMLREADFSTPEGVTAFVKVIDTALRFDLRDDALQPVCIADLVRKGTEPIDVYNYVFGRQSLSSLCTDVGCTHT